MQAERFLVGRQSAVDGGWVCKGEADLFSRHHASLVAVAALMDHSYAAHGPVFPRAVDVLPHWFCNVPPLPKTPPTKQERKQAKKLARLQRQLMLLKQAATSEAGCDEQGSAQLRLSPIPMPRTSDLRPSPSPLTSTPHLNLDPTPTPRIFRDAPIGTAAQKS